MTSLGRVVAGRYRMLYPLGRGGMGSVWVGEHTELLSKVAVKFIDSFLAQDESARKRFRIEAQAAAALRSPHVVQVFDYGVDQGDPYIVMELLQGETLAQRMRRLQRISVEETAIIAEQVGRALDLAHGQGIVHRDLKPENVFLLGERDGFSVKLLDFGVVKVIREDPRWTELVTQPGNRLGTLYYMSPEQIEGATIDARADIWSLAVLLFECLTGRLPFNGIRGPALISTICRSALTVPSTIARVPPGFDELFASATCRAFSRREPSVRAFADRFQAIAQGRVGTCELVHPPEGDPVRRVLAYSSSHNVIDDVIEETLRTELSDSLVSSIPAATIRQDKRVTTSIPAAINGRRDMEHVALVAELSRKKGLLWTAHRVPVGETIHLALLFGDTEVGHMTSAVVEKFSSEKSDARPDIWPYEVLVRFESPLPEGAGWKR